MSKNTNTNQNLPKEILLFVAVVAMIAIPLVTGMGAIGEMLATAASVVLISAIAILLFPFIGYPLLLLVSLPAQLLVRGKKKTVVEKPVVLTAVK